MPSPVGHALAGLAIGWAASSRYRAPEAGTPVPSWAARARRAVAGLPALAAAVALLPDLDLVLDSHRTFSHSIGAAVLVGAAAGVAAHFCRRPARLTGATCAAAFASHVLLDWLGRDSSAPAGVMALWPLSQHFYASGLDVFAEISRRYWNPAEFVVGNLRSVAQELILLGPLALAAFLRYRRRPPGAS